MEVFATAVEGIAIAAHNRDIQLLVVKLVNTGPFLERIMPPLVQFPPLTYSQLAGISLSLLRESLHPHQCRLWFTDVPREGVELSAVVAPDSQQPIGVHLAPPFPILLQTSIRRFVTNSSDFYMEVYDELTSVFLAGNQLAENILLIQGTYSLLH
ncbi:unnamed protein product [Sphagnum balticum]